MSTKDELTVDWLSIIGSVVDSDADGIAQVVVSSVPPNVAYLVEGVLWTTSDRPLPAAGTAFSLYAEAPPPGAGSPIPSDTALRSFTTGWTEAEADYASPRRFYSGEVITARWEGFTPGFDAAITLQVRVTQQIIIPEPTLRLPEEHPEQLSETGETWN